MQRRHFLFGLASTPLLAACGSLGCSRGEAPSASSTTASAEPARDEVVLGPAPPIGDRLVLTEAEWRDRLTESQYYVLREKGTERPYTDRTWDEHRAGTYVCAGCGAPLFASVTKFESGTGWPSFTAPIEDGRVLEDADTAFGMVRTEVLCARCNGHLGHVFPDGPEPTGLRYCINGVAMNFARAEE